MRFSACPERPWGPPVMGRVELYLYPPSGPPGLNHNTNRDASISYSQEAMKVSLFAEVIR